MDQVYSATYSGVAVYEFINSTGSVMRRKTDGWVNATHILKAANFPKAKRTRILERDVQVGEHEKVQGGYGKYQGTWVPLDRAKSIAQEFGVDGLLAPLFIIESTNGANSPPPAPKHHHASKNSSINLGTEKAAGQRKAAAAARKIASVPIISTTLQDEDTESASSKKKRGRPRRLNAPIGNPNKGVFTGKRLASHDERLGKVPSSPTDSTIFDTRDSGFESKDDTNVEDFTELNIEDGLSSEIDENGQLNFIDSSSPSEFMSDTDLANALKSPNQKINRSARESLERAITTHTEHIRSINEESQWFDTNAEYTSRLLEYFMTPDDDTDSIIPDFVLNPPKGVSFDRVIDEEGNTAFHWACSMGNVQAVEVWINLGVNYRIVNNKGETALMRSVLFTNSCTKKTFPRLVELLSETIFEFDSTHKTVLHHIAGAGLSKARVPSAFYYMDILLARIAESQTSDRLQGFLNLQDSNGDTALHLCARNGNRNCIKLLLEYKAKGNIRNNQGLIASDILLEHESINPKIQQRYELHLRNQRAKAIPSTPAAIPHLSEAAIEATHKVSNVLAESLVELSNAYDSELQRKEADVNEVQELLNNLNEDIITTKSKTDELIGEVLDDKQLDDRVNLLQDQVERHEKLAATKERKLLKLFERSQAKSLSKLVQDNEKTISRESLLVDNENRLELASDLTKLQLQRKRLIDEIIELHGGINGKRNEKMQKYRRLISACSDVRVDQVSDKVDELLQELEASL